MPHSRHTSLGRDVVTTVGDMQIMVKEKTIKTPTMSSCIVSELLLTAICIGLTFASLHALNKTVVDVSVATISTILMPSTTRSATTYSSGFLEHTTV